VVGNFDVFGHQTGEREELIISFEVHDVTPDANGYDDDACLRVSKSSVDICRRRGSRI
jgi:hypothetical protein